MLRLMVVDRASSIAVAIAAALLAGCTSQAPAPRQPDVVVVSGVQQVTGPVLGLGPAPVRGAVRLAAEDGRVVVVTSGADGTFTARVAPGRYTLRGTQRGSSFCPPVGPIQVRAGQPVVDLVVGCHTR